MDIIRKSFTDGRNAGNDRHHDSFHPDPRDVAKARVVIHHALKNGGDTITRGYLPFPVDGFYVVGGYAPKQSFQTSGKSLDTLAALLHKFVVSSPSFIVPSFIGIWIHDGRIYFDVVKLHRSLVDAVTDGIANKQLAIYDGTFHQDIPLT